MDTLYTAVATSIGDGRNGSARTSDGILEVQLATPVEMGGAGGATNPEQLFALGYSACFHSALKGQAKRLGLEPTDTAVTAEVGIGKLPDGGFGLEVALRVELANVTEAEGRSLVEAAHEVCPYSNATRGNIVVTLDLDVA